MRNRHTIRSVTSPLSLSALFLSFCLTITLCFPLGAVASPLSQSVVFDTNTTSSTEGETEISSSGSSDGVKYEPSEILVVFNDDVSDDRRAQTIAEAQSVTMDNSTTSFEAIDKETAIVPVAENASVEQAVSELNQDDSVAYAQPNYLYTFADDSVFLQDESTAAAEVCVGQEDELSVQSSTNDTYYSSQEYLRTISASNAWDSTRSEHRVSVAVLDSGIDTTHPDLANNIAVAICATTGDSDSSPNDTFGHGTHIAGIISAQANNGIGIAGASYNADLVSVRVVNRSGRASSSDIVAGYRYIIDNASTYNIKAVNMSLGGVGSYRSKDAALKQAIVAADNAGIITVCASGNAGYYDGSRYSSPFECWPGNFDDVIGKDTILTVGNLASDNTRAYDSNYGPFLDLMAPGTDILSTDIGGSYDRKSGTSMATPMVAASVAMCFAAVPTASTSLVRKALEYTASDLGSVGRDDEYGYGLVNVRDAILCLQNRLVFRLYNKVSKEHLYTIDANEKTVLSMLPDWAYEGVAWIAPASGSDVKRAYNPVSGEHVYTQDANEIATLVGRYGWRNEGVSFYSSGGKEIPMHRLFNPAAGIGAHHYTADTNEYTTLKRVGWKDEGVSWYAVSRR